MLQIFHSHPWNVSLEEAREIQEKVAEYVIAEDRFEKIETVAGVGINFRTSDLVVSIVRFTFPGLEKLDFASGKFLLSFPYTPNFFAFSCGPAILSILEKIELPDLLIFPGKGIIHPRKVGLATHLGILLDVPTIACSKRALNKNYPEPKKKKGSFEYNLEGKEKVGVALRSRNNTKPIFISPGNKISLDSSLEIILHCCTKYRLPEPLRQAQILARKEIAGTN
ncbi:MAG TPA: endonuclease V [Terriglobales bacterium]|nr:endonuclease V [Terriglobales bacterium]